MRLIQTLLISTAIAAALGVTSASAAATAAASEPASDSRPYLTLREAQSTEKSAKVEVIEFFAYTCPHCKVFEPVLAEWVKKNAGKIAFKRVHVAFRPADQVLQRVHATLEALKAVEAYHAKLFTAIHENNVRFNSDEDAFNWAESAGLERSNFIATYRSFGVQARVTRAQAMVAAYQIDQWPMLAVGGRFMTSPHLASVHAKAPMVEALQHQAALQVLDGLVSKVKAEKK